MTTATARTPTAAEGAPAPSRRSAVLAWGSCGLYLAAIVFAGATTPTDAELGPVFDLLIPLGLLAYPVVGAIIGVRRPGNVIGRLFLGVGVLFGLGIASEAYAIHQPQWPGTAYAAWTNLLTINSPTLFTLFAFFLLLFPDGHLASRRWRHLARFSIGITSVMFVFLWLKPGTYEVSGTTFTNPFAIHALGTAWVVLEGPLFIGVMVCVPAAAVCFVLRFRRSRGTERQQLKWFAAAAVLVGAIVAAAPVVFSTESLWWLWPAMFFIATTSIPVAAGIAVFRYRLYDIDRIISRTVSYAIVTALLAGLYAVVAVVVPSAFLGTGDTPDGVIAGATLLVAAVFVPVRRRVQNAVDRRFNRSRYDAARTIEGFTARLRDEIDIDALGAELRQVIHRAMQPSHVDLWLAKR